MIQLIAHELCNLFVLELTTYLMTPQDEYTLPSMVYQDTPSDIRSYNQTLLDILDIQSRNSGPSALVRSIVGLLQAGTP